MMKFLTLKNLTLAALLGAALTLAGCRTAPVYNVDNADVMVTGKGYTLADVSKAIRLAGASLGWNMHESSPGHIVGTLHLRSHTAVVDIPYSKKHYSIKYKSSENLNYDGTKIHSNYNGWVQRLDNAIRVQLSGL